MGVLVTSGSERGVTERITSPSRYPPAHAWSRWLEHAVVGWAICALAIAALFALVPERTAIALHALWAPIAFAAVANHYFRPRGARKPLATAAFFTGVVAALDLALALGLDLPLATSVLGFWVPLAAIFFVTWGIGALRAMFPLPGRVVHGG